MSDCLRVYTDVEPEFKNLRRILERLQKMKKKKHIKRNNDRKNFGGRDRGEKFSTKRSMRNNDQQIIRNMQSGKINVEDLEDYYDDHG